MRYLYIIVTLVVIFHFKVYIIQPILPTYLVEPNYCVDFEQFMIDMLIVVD